MVKDAMGKSNNAIVVKCDAGKTSHDEQAGLGSFLVVCAYANCRDLMPLYRLIYLWLLY